MNGLRALTPWWLKILVKIALSNLPIPYAFWKRVGVFVAGTMEDGAYAFNVFSRHFERARPPEGFHCLELGPGDSVATAIVARMLGASRTWLVDTGRYASPDVQLYRRIRDYAAARTGGTLGEFGSVDELLAITNATYLTDGASSLRNIPDSSVDLIFSHAVLEHIRLAELDGFLRELRRIIRPSGAMSHDVDLKDHLSASLNSLRFPGRLWESRAFARAGFYTNRIRCSDLLARIERAGFTLRSVEKQRWDRLPIARGALATPFASLPDDDLLVRDVSVIAGPA